MRTFASAIIFATIGAFLGIGGVYILGTGFGKDSLWVAIILLAGFGIGAGVIAFWRRLILERQIKELNPEKIKALYDQALSDSEKDVLDLTKLLMQGRNEFLAIGKLVINALTISQSIAFVAIALSAMVSVATLLTAYVQIERMEQQNQLIETQNTLAEASRRSTLNFELTAILDQLSSAATPTDFLINRAASFSHALLPYRRLDNSNVLTELLSPERGQLLNSLLISEIKFDKFTDKFNFSYAEAPSAKFTKKNVAGINLNNANLSNSTFDRSILANAKLANTNLSNSTFRGADLSSANITGALLPSANAFINSQISDWNIDGAKVPDKNWLFYLANNSFSEQEEGEYSEKGYTYVLPRSHKQYLYHTYKTDEKGVIEPVIRSALSSNPTVEVLKGWSTNELIIERNDKAKIRSDSISEIVNVLGNISNYTSSSEFYESVNEILLDDELLVTNFGDYGIIGDASLTYLFEEWFISYGQTTCLEGVIISECSSMPGNFIGISPGGIDNIIEMPSDMNFTDANFNFSDLRYVDFKNANLSDVSFSDAWMPPYKNISSTKLDGADFTSAKVSLDWPNPLIINDYKWVGRKECVIFRDFPRDPDLNETYETKRCYLILEDTIKDDLINLPLQD